MAEPKLFKFPDKIHEVQAKEAIHRLGWTVNKCRDCVILAKKGQDPEAPLFTRWFGKLDANRYSKVLTVFNTMCAKIQEEIQLIYEYGGPPGKFAFVYREDKPPIQIHLRERFFQVTKQPAIFYPEQMNLSEKQGKYNAYMEATSCTVATIIHELSHYTWIGDTEDHKDGYGPALELAADTQSDLAVKNADNYGYFGLEVAYQYETAMLSGDARVPGTDF